MSIAARPTTTRFAPTRTWVTVSAICAPPSTTHHPHIRLKASYSVSIISARTSARRDAIVRASKDDPGLVVVANEPLSDIDVDKDLWAALDLCTDEELEQLYEILNSTSPFSPLVKSLVSEQEPPLLEQRGRVSLMYKMESRFRFLAADSMSMLQGRRPGYRETLLNIRERLGVSCSSNLDTPDLESEVFLYLLNNCTDYIAQDVNDEESVRSAAATLEGDGMAIPPEMQQPNKRSWFERITGPVAVGLQEAFPTFAKLSGVVTVTAVGQAAAQNLGAQLVTQHLKYQATLHACTGAARGALSGLGKQAALKAASSGLIATSARYGAVRGAMSLLGPLMWGWLVLDLGLKTIGTDYLRIIRAVFLLAQVRLVRTYGFVNPK